MNDAPLPSTRWAEEELEDLTGRGLRRELEVLATAQGAVVEIGGRSLVNFSSNDYLGLASHPRVVEALARGARLHGAGSGSSRLLTGDVLPHRTLEEALARFHEAPAALLFGSGYAANVGVLSTLCGPDDVIFSDALNHASLIDGCRLSRAKVVVYPHLDVAALRRALSATPGGRRVVVTESVFSMDGDLAPLAELSAAAQAHGAALVVDEAHALGVLGPSGAGLCQALGLAGQVDVRTATLGKALGAHGAYAVTSGAVRELLLNRARPFVFSTAPSPAVCAAAEEALTLCRQDLPRRERLTANIARFAAGLEHLGLPGRSASAIFPVVLGEATRALEAARFLRGRGLLVKAIRPPTVPAGTSRLRFSLCADHTPQQLDAALEALGALRREAA